MIKIGPIVMKKGVRLARGPMVSRRSDKKPKKKSSALKEQRIGSSEI
jgi:hypothetical protein